MPRIITRVTRAIYESKVKQAARDNVLGNTPIAEWVATLCRDEALCTFVRVKLGELQPYDRIAADVINATTALRTKLAQGNIKETETMKSKNTTAPATTVAVEAAAPAAAAPKAPLVDPAKARAALAARAWLAAAIKGLKVPKTGAPDVDHALFLQELAWAQTRATEVLMPRADRKAARAARRLARNEQRLDKVRAKAQAAAAAKEAKKAAAKAPDAPTEPTPPKGPKGGKKAPKAAPASLAAEAAQLPEVTMTAEQIQQAMQLLARATSMLAKKGAA